MYCDRRVKAPLHVASAEKFRNPTQLYSNISYFISYVYQIYQLKTIERAFVDF